MPASQVGLQEAGRRHNNRCRDIIFHLELYRANEILTQFERPPTLRGEQAHPEIGTHKLAAKGL